MLIIGAYKDSNPTNYKRVGEGYPHDQVDKGVTKYSN